MKENKNTATHPVRDFTKKFILNYLIGLLLIGIVISFISEILAEILPEALQLVANLLLTIFGLWKVVSSAAETSLKEVPVESEHMPKLKKNIFIFLIVLFVLEIVFAFISFKKSCNLLSGFEDIFMTKLISKIIASIIQYSIILWFSKKKLEELLLNK